MLHESSLDRKNALIIQLPIITIISFNGYYYSIVMNFFHGHIFRQINNFHLTIVSSWLYTKSNKWDKTE